MTPTLETLLGHWQHQDWLHAVDLALVRFLTETDPTAPEGLLLATALLSAMERRGHTALPWTEPEEVLPARWADSLGWPAEALPSLTNALSATGTLAAFRDWTTALAGFPSQATGTASTSVDRSCTATPATPATPPTTPPSLSLEADPNASTANTPLVFGRAGLQWRRHWSAEARIARTLVHRAAMPPVEERTATGAAGLTEAAVLDLLFPADRSTPQRHACSTAQSGRLTLITGGPGTGKTYTAARVLVLLQALRHSPLPLQVALAAPTGKAAARLRLSITSGLQSLPPAVRSQLKIDDWEHRLRPAQTLHALLGTAPSGVPRRKSLSDIDVLLVDESSMMDVQTMDTLLAALPPTARLVLLGDPHQLASVEAGAVLADLCTAAPLTHRTVHLQHTHRFSGPLGRLAQAVNAGDAPAVVETLHRPEAPDAPLQWHRQPQPEALAALTALAVGQGGYRPYLEWVAAGPAAAGGHEAWVQGALRRFDAFRVLCAVREGPWGVDGLNAAIDAALVRHGLLSRDRSHPIGRPILVTRNQPTVGVFNGDVGLVLPGPEPGHDGTLRCWFMEGDQIHSVALQRLSDTQPAYALTVHKSQGSEFARVALVLPPLDIPLLSREWLYTGITRSRSRLDLFCHHAAVLEAAVQRRTVRATGLGVALEKGIGPGGSP